MAVDSRAVRALRSVIRGVSPLSDTSRKLRNRLEAEWIRALDEVVSLLARRPVRTTPTATRPRLTPRTAPQGEATPERAPPNGVTPDAGPGSGAVAMTPPAHEPDSAIAPPQPVLQAPAPLKSPPSREDARAPAAPVRSPEAVREEPDAGTTAELPRRYGSGRLTLIARDPEWAHLYWDAPVSDVPSGRWVVRLLEAVGQTVVHEAAVSPSDHRYYFRLPRSDQGYVAELLFAAEGGSFEIEARSNVVAAPPLAPRPLGGRPAFVRPTAQAAILKQPFLAAQPPKLEDETTRLVFSERTERTGEGSGSPVGGPAPAAWSHPWWSWLPSSAEALRGAGLPSWQVLQYLFGLPSSHGLPSSPGRSGRALGASR